MGGKTKLIDAADQGALDGFRVDRDGNLWCGWGTNGALQAEPTDVGGRKVFQLKGKSEDLDGVMVFSPAGKPLAHIRLPERCANLTFGGPKNNRLYMTSCHSVYALYVEVARRGLVICHSGAMRSIEPGTSRFRVWSFGPSRNDE